MSREAAARFLVTSFNSGFEHVFPGVYFVGIFAAPVLMGVALWRSRSVPRWLAVLFVIGLEVAQQVASAGPKLVVVLMLPFAVAMLLLAVRTWRAATQPASQGSAPTEVTTPGRPVEDAAVWPVTGPLLPGRNAGRRSGLTLIRPGLSTRVGWGVIPISRQAPGRHAGTMTTTGASPEADWQAVTDPEASGHSAARA